ncbi:hypothetical protein BDP27DRAFT_1375702 [Rhodocollybia butyracea]|uniref:Uncharacterized protein n=1 Tax=Rhodocollybia butyracea TaxID=206335 RepID=A0A9P5TVG0_9AGAR|nr:hypothetical protein BDP27DRAFT_1375702 [Rhodocollybia butyracea]
MARQKSHKKSKKIARWAFKKYTKAAGEASNGDPIWNVGISCKSEYVHVFLGTLPSNIELIVKIASGLGGPTPTTRDIRKQAMPARRLQARAQTVKNPFLKKNIAPNHSPAKRRLVLSSSEDEDSSDSGGIRQKRLKRSGGLETWASDKAVQRVDAPNPEQNSGEDGQNFLSLIGEKLLGRSHGSHFKWTCVHQVLQILSMPMSLSCAAQEADNPDCFDNYISFEPAMEHTMLNVDFIIEEDAIDSDTELEYPP